MAFEPNRRGIGYERRILFLAVLALLPWMLLAVFGSRYGWLEPGVRGPVYAAAAVMSIISLAALARVVAWPLRSIANVIASIREEDLSFRLRGAQPDDAMGEVMVEINDLVRSLRTDRLGATEATALARAVIRQLDSAIFTFDREERLQFVNTAGARLLGRPAAQLIGCTAVELQLDHVLSANSARTDEMTFPGAQGRFAIRSTTFREGGHALHLLVISDLSRALRDEEREAWRRLVRVIGHEVNNSLAPVQSIASSLTKLASKENLPPEFARDLEGGLEIIGMRSKSLSRFMKAYSRLARLPRPRIVSVDVDALVRRIIALASDPRVTLEPGETEHVMADPDQLEQALINLVRNAIDAVEGSDGRVTIGWRRDARLLAITVRDEGPGISGRTGLFVPFFTTKPGGTGIGLVFSRQIAEAHGGSLVLEDRTDRRGCEARLTLPLDGNTGQFDSGFRPSRNRDAERAT